MITISPASPHHVRLSQALQLRAVGKLGNRGVEFSFAGTRNLTSITAVTLGLSVGLDGVSVTVKARRGRHNIYVPIKISARADPWTILTGSMINATLNASLILLLRPFEKIKLQRQLRLVEKEMSEKQSRERRNAAAQVRLMVEAAKKKEETERNMQGGGLIILEAHYGTPLPSASNGKPPDPDWYYENRDGDHDLDLAPSLDVRIPLQFFVSKSRLYLPPGSKAGILGFYDMAANPTWLLKATNEGGGWGENLSNGSHKKPWQRPAEQRAQLYIRYLWQRKVYEISIDDCRSLDLPCADEKEVTCLGNEGHVF